MRVFVGLICLALALPTVALGLATSAAAQVKIRANANPPAPPASTAPTVVEFEAAYEPGSIVIANSERRLYYVLGDGKAVRYGVAVGNPDEVWTGRQMITAKKENPRWVSPDDDEWNYEGGDPENPLGVRAMYLGWTLWRIHGTPNPRSIGRAVSNGCIRMRNEDVVDLFERVHLGAPVFAVEKLSDPMPTHAARKVSDD